VCPLGALGALLNRELALRIDLALELIHGRLARRPRAGRAVRSPSPRLIRPNPAPHTSQVRGVLRCRHPPDTRSRRARDPDSMATTCRTELKAQSTNRLSADRVYREIRARLSICIDARRAYGGPVDTTLELQRVGASRRRARRMS
jgi:hypothetical protein